VEGNFHGCAPLLVEMVFFQDTEPAGETEEKIWQTSSWRGPDGEPFRSSPDPDFSQPA